MIKINLVSPYESKIDAKVNEYVNKNLKVMIEVYRDYLNENDGWSIKEKLLDAFPRAFIVQNDHIEELIEDLYEIIYSHTIINQLEKKTYEKYEIIEICEKPFGNDYMYLIKSTHIIPEDTQRCMGIYHIILDLNDKYRQDVAIEAREGK